MARWYADGHLKTTAMSCFGSHLAVHGFNDAANKIEAKPATHLALGISCTEKGVKDLLQFPAGQFFTEI